MKKLVFLLPAFAVLILQWGCSKDAEDPVLTEAQKLEGDEIQTLLKSDTIGGIVDGILSTAYLQKEQKQDDKEESCRAITYDANGFSVVFENCSIGNDVIDGSVIVNYQGEKNSLAYTATFNELKVNNITISGSRSYVLLAKNNGEAYSYSVESDLLILGAHESAISESGKRNVHLFIGKGLEDSGIRVDGRWNLVVGETRYEATTVDPLVANLSCAYVVEGSININKNGSTALVDFGDRTCDNKGSVSYENGLVTEFTMD